MARDVMARNLYGLMAEYDDVGRLLLAAERVRDAGYTRIDACTPFPVEGLDRALGPERNWVPPLVLLGGILGGAIGYFGFWYTAAFTYPLNVGGRPTHSWPSYVPLTFECIVLSAAIFAVVGMLALNGLPRPYHPAFNVDRFAAAGSDGFFLIVEAADPKFDLKDTRRFLQETGAREVFDVDH